MERQRGQILPGGHKNGTVTGRPLRSEREVSRHARAAAPAHFAIGLVALLAHLLPARVGRQRGARQVVAVKVGLGGLGCGPHRHHHIGATVKLVPHRDRNCSACAMLSLANGRTLSTSPLDFTQERSTT